MAAKFPSIALVKYRGRGERARRRRRRGRGRGTRGQVDGPGPRETSCRGCRGKDASQLRKLRLCSRPLRAHRPRKSVTTSGGAPVVLPRWRRTASPGEEIRGTFTCVHVAPRRCTVCSADALDYLRFTLQRGRWFEWIASDAPPCRRMLRASERAVERRTLVTEAHDGTRTFAGVIGRAYLIF